MGGERENSSRATEIISVAREERRKIAEERKRREGRERGREGNFRGDGSFRKERRIAREREREREIYLFIYFFIFSPLLATEFPSRERERGEEMKRKGEERKKRGEAFPPASPRDGISVARERARGRERNGKGEKEEREERSEIRRERR